MRPYLFGTLALTQIALGIGGHLSWWSVAVLIVLLTAQFVLGGTQNES